jgi:lysophospholipase L1-like esterase
VSKKYPRLRKTQPAASMKRRQKGIFIISLGIVLILAAVIVFLFFREMNDQKDLDETSSNSSVSSSSGSSLESLSSLPESSLDSSSSRADLSSSQPAEPPASAVESSETSQEQPAWNPADNLNPSVPNAAPGDFSHSLFIGDSRTEGLMRYTNLTSLGAVFYTSTGLNVKTAMSKGIVPDAQGNLLTIPQALSTAQFNKVYIMLGVNELGWAYSNIFIEEYTKLIQAVQAAEPNASIYVQSIVPVSAEKNASDPIYNNTKIAEYNALIRQMAQNLGVGYLDVQQGIVDETGCLPAGASVDGIHMNKEYCQKWMDYLQANS